jgi:hypothetical protein
MIEEYKVGVTVKNNINNQKYIILYIDEVVVVLKPENNLLSRMYLNIKGFKNHYVKAASIRQRFADFLSTDVLNEHEGYFYTLLMTDIIFDRFDVSEKISNKNNVT